MKKDFDFEGALHNSALSEAFEFIDSSNDEENVKSLIDSSDYYVCIEKLKELYADLSKAILDCYNKGYCSVEYRSPWGDFAYVINLDDDLTVSYKENSGEGDVHLFYLDDSNPDIKSLSLQEDFLTVNLASKEIINIDFLKGLEDPKSFKNNLMIIGSIQSLLGSVQSKLEDLLKNDEMIRQAAQIISFSLPEKNQGAFVKLMDSDEASDEEISLYLKNGSIGMQSLHRPTKSRIPNSVGFIVNPASFPKLWDAFMKLPENHLMESFGFEDDEDEDEIPEMLVKQRDFNIKMALFNEKLSSFISIIDQLEEKHLYSGENANRPTFYWEAASYIILTNLADGTRRYSIMDCEDSDTIAIDRDVEFIFTISKDGSLERWLASYELSSSEKGDLHDLISNSKIFEYVEDLLNRCSSVFQKMLNDKDLIPEAKKFQKWIFDNERILRDDYIRRGIFTTEWFKCDKDKIYYIDAYRFYPGSMYLQEEYE